MKIALCSSCIELAINDKFEYRTSVLNQIINSANNITILNDSEGKVLDSYQNIVTNENYELIAYWMETLNKQKKIKKVKIINNYSENIYINTLANYSLARRLLTNNEDNYEEFGEEIMKFNIELFDRHGSKSLVNNTASHSTKNLLESILEQLCILMGRSFVYKVEDFHTAELCTGLQTLGFDVYNTNKGVSDGKKAEGELDLYVQKNRLPISVIEALRESSCGMGNTNISTHLNKLLNNYDCWGLYENFLIVYYEGKNLKDFWSKYIKYMKEINSNNNFSDAIPQKEFTDITSDITEYADIKIGKGIYDRNGSDVNVYHIVCDFSVD